MDIADRMRDAEARFREIVDDAGLTPPDHVDHQGEEILFRWDEARLVVVVDCSEGAVEPALVGGIGGWGQA